MQSSLLRTRWAAIGAAVAVTLGAGGIGLVSATSPAGAVAYVPIEPCRAADTRPGTDNVGPRATPIGTAETHVVNSNDGQCSGDVPATATGLQLNVTAVGASEGSFITIWASGTRPLASSLNPTPGEPPVPNAVTTGITGAGNFNLYNNAGSVHVIVDIVGFYTDHNHDDRYYTETEVDAALGAKANSTDVYTKAEVDALLAGKLDAANVMWAVVNADGTLAQNEGAVAGGTNKLGTGVYEVAFNRDITTCAAIGNPADESSTGVTADEVTAVQRLFDNTSVFVESQNSSGTLVDSAFTIVVICP